MEGSRGRGEGGATGKGLRRATKAARRTVARPPQVVHWNSSVKSKVCGIFHLSG